MHNDVHKRTRYLAISFIALLFIFVISLFIYGFKISYIDALFLFSCPALIFLIMLLSTYKQKIYFVKDNYPLLNYFILGKWVDDLILPLLFKNTLKGLVTKTARRFLPIILHFIYCLLPGIIVYRNYDGDNTYYAKSIGIYVVFCGLLIIFSYLIVILPRIISFKANNNDNNTIYILWRYFLESRFINGPVTLYFGIPIFIIICVIIVYSPFIPKLSISNIDSYVYNVDIISYLVSIVSLWLSMAVIIGSEFLHKYVRLYECFEEHTTYLLRQALMENKGLDIILLGFGNLGKIVSGYVLKHECEKDVHIASRKTIHNKYLRMIERYYIDKIAGTIFSDKYIVIVDKNIKPRIIPRNIVIIEKKEGLFEEIRIDSYSGYTIGFINGEDTIIEDKYKTTSFGDYALLGINSDGGELPVLKTVNVNSAKYLINTTSDSDMGFRLKKYLNKDMISTATILITTVEDSTAYSFLENTKETVNAIFPLHTGLAEGSALGSRIFMLIEKCGGIRKGKSIYLLGKGRTIYYILDTLRQQLINRYGYDDIVDNYLRDNVTVVTSDPIIALDSYQKEPNDYTKRSWCPVLSGKILKGIKHKAAESDRYSVLYKAIYKDRKKTSPIFVISTPHGTDTIRMAEHIKQVLAI